MQRVRISLVLPVVACCVLLGALSGPVAAQRRQSGGFGLTVFDDVNFRGRSATFRNDIPNLQSVRFNDQISSLQVGRGEVWEACEDSNYRGRCQVFSGEESDLRRGGWSDVISSVRRVRNDGGRGGRGGGGGGPFPQDPPSRGGLELFSRPGFAGERRVFTTGMSNLQQVDFNDQAMSLRVGRRETWQVCADANYQNCIVVDGDAANLTRIGMMGRISSVRPWRGGNRR